MKISDRQIMAVTALPGPKRYAHFIKVAADQNRVWGLFDEGWALAGTDDEAPIFPLWPAREYAQLCCTGPWSKCEPTSIALEELFAEMLPSLRERKTSLGIFYTTADKGVVPSLDQFESDLREELRRIE